MLLGSAACTSLRCTEQRQDHCCAPVGMEHRVAGEVAEDMANKLSKEGFQESFGWCWSPKNKTRREYVQLEELLRLLGTTLRVLLTRRKEKVHVCEENKCHCSGG